MKTIIIFSVVLFLSNLASAQTEINLQHNSGVQTLKPQNTIIEEATKYTNRIFTTTGSTYHASDLNIMPTRSINKIAGLTMGVNSYNGGTPIIRGAVDGTAYFVDGVRIRSGALGIAGFNW